MKAVVAAFNQEKALVGAFSVITNLRKDLFESLVWSVGTNLMITRDYFPASLCLCLHAAEVLTPRRAQRGHEDSASISVFTLTLATLLTHTKVSHRFES